MGSKETIDTELLHGILDIKFKTLNGNLSGDGLPRVTLILLYAELLAAFFSLKSLLKNSLRWKVFLKFFKELILVFIHYLTMSDA